MDALQICQHRTADSDLTANGNILSMYSVIHNVCVESYKNINRLIHMHTTDVDIVVVAVTAIATAAVTAFRFFRAMNANTVFGFYFLLLLLTVCIISSQR